MDGKFNNSNYTNQHITIKLNGCPGLNIGILAGEYMYYGCKSNDVEIQMGVELDSGESYVFHKDPATDENGVALVKGLDDGTYLIEEVTAPAGYNAIVGDKTIVIEATTDNGDSWDGVASSALINIANDADSDALVDVQVINNKGAVLPETGSFGTALFITVGSVMVLGAVVILVVRKKMSVYED